MPSGIPMRTSSVGVPMIPRGSPSTMLNFTIPDEHVGAIVGRGGIITDIQQVLLSGVFVQPHFHVSFFFYKVFC